MKFEVTNPKAWKAINEKNIPMSHKIKVYEKLGGAYRLGEDGGEQVFNKMTELLKHKIKEDDDSYFNSDKEVNTEDGPDHEVSMAMNSLESIMKAADELKEKLAIGGTEKDIPAWIQDHITNSENYIKQAASGYYEYNNNDNK